MRNVNLPAILNRHIAWFSFFLLLIGILCFNHVLELRAEEGRRAIVSMEMLQMDEYTVPHLQGLPYYNKPPLYNWVLVASFKMLQTCSEFAVRLPGVLSYLATALLVFLFGRRYVNREMALLMAGACLTVADTLFYGSINAGEIDLFYSLVVVLQALVIFHFAQKDQYLPLYAFSYALTAVGVLTKGLPSIAFQGLTLVVYFALTKRFRKLFTWQHFAGIAIFLVLTASYFYFYAAKNEVTGYLINLFKQASQRSANEYGLQDIIGTILFFPVYLFRFLLPWSLFAFFLFFRHVRKALFENPFIAFSVIFILANIPLYWTAPELRIRYIYMFFPFFSIVFIYAGFIAWKQGYKLTAWIHKTLQAAIGLIGLGCLVLVFFPFGEGFFAMAVLVVTGLLLITVSFLFNRFSIGGGTSWLLILSLAIARLSYDLVGLPYTQSQMKYRKLTEEMLTQCNNCEVNLTGPAVALVPDITLMGKTFYRDTLYIPQEIPYQIPYYQALETGHILIYQEKTVPGAYYISFEHAGPPPGQILTRYAGVYGGGTFVLFQAGQED